MFKQMLYDIKKQIFFVQLFFFCVVVESSYGLRHAAIFKKNFTSAR